MESEESGPPDAANAPEADATTHARGTGSHRSKSGKRLKNFLLSAEAERLLVETSRSLGITQTALIELAIRHYAKQHRDEEAR